MSLFNFSLITAYQYIFLELIFTNPKRFPLPQASIAVWLYLEVESNSLTPRQHLCFVTRRFLVPNNCDLTVEFIPSAPITVSALMHVLSSKVSSKPCPCSIFKSRFDNCIFSKPISLANFFCKSAR